MVITHIPHNNHKPKIYKRYTYKKYNTKYTHQIRKKRGKRSKKRTIETINKMAVSTYLSIITLNINGPNAPIQR